MRILLIFMLSFNLYAQTLIGGMYDVKTKFYPENCPGGLWAVQDKDTKEITVHCKKPSTIKFDFRPHFIGPDKKVYLLTPTQTPQTIVIELQKQEWHNRTHTSPY